jgi:hypothetical protein
MKYKKTQFKTKHIRKLNNREKRIITKIVLDLENKNTCNIALLPSFVSNDNKKRLLILNNNIINKIEKDHGKIILQNLIINANDWDYVIKNVDKNTDKINLIKVINSKGLLLIGANRINGYFMLTYFEITTKNSQTKLKNLLQRGDSLNNTGGAAFPSSATFL